MCIQYDDLHSITQEFTMFCFHIVDMIYRELPLKDNIACVLDIASYVQPLKLSSLLMPLPKLPDILILMLLNAFSSFSSLYNLHRGSPLCHNILHPFMITIPIMAPWNSPYVSSKFSNQGLGLKAKAEWAYTCYHHSLLVNTQAHMQQHVESLRNDM